MENVINPNFIAHLYYEQHPDSREAQLMRCMETLEKIAKAKDMLEAYKTGCNGNSNLFFYGNSNLFILRIEALERHIKVLQSRYNAQIRTLEPFKKN